MKYIRGLSPGAMSVLVLKKKSVLPFGRGVQLQELCVEETDPREMSTCELVMV